MQHPPAVLRSMKNQVVFRSVLFTWREVYFKVVVMIQFSSVAQSCPILADRMNHSTSGLPVYHHLLEFT